MLYLIYLFYNVYDIFIGKFRRKTSKFLNKDSYISQPSAQEEIVASGYEYTKLSIGEALPNLADVLAHPEKYRSLLVRVAGYSAQFTNLSKEMQDSIMARNAHEEF